jgi:cardiolipin synthase
MQPDNERSKINIPNMLTVLRILLTPLLVIFLQRRMMGSALLVFTIAGISDGLDGFLARTFNQRTVLGAYLDPLADKLLLMSAFVSLAFLGILPSWLTVVVISRDILIVLGIAICTLWHVHVAIRPSKISKVTTFVQIATIFFLLLDTHIPASDLIKTSLIWGTAIVTTASGIHYLYLGLHLLQGSEQDQQDPGV